ncbi:MAG: family 78 glycoside hydrolase catalytic domain, partial [Bacteroidetes bacterium]|nr:family 78 glycoside hydrolase catalytic domain [Bacteroidota bacterium]
MKRISLLLISIVATVTLSAQALKVDLLRCDSRIEPAGVEGRPRLSWILQSVERNTLQTAYRILVADNPASLAANKGNIWDSQKVMTDSSIQVAYAGPALRPAATYYWKVTVWDNHQNNSGWSAVASWQMGLPGAADWKGAQWIGYEELPEKDKIIPAVHGKGKKEWGAGKDILPLLRKQFTVNKPLRKATLFICGLGHFDVHINGSKAGDHFLDPGWTQYDKQALYVPFDITSQLRTGANAIGVMLGNGFYYIPRERYRKLTGAFGYPKMIARILLEYADGSTADIISDPSWTAAPGPIVFSSIYGGEDYDANLEQAGWDKAGFDDRKWKHTITVAGVPQLDAQTAEPLKVMDTFTAKKVTVLSSGARVYDLGQNASGIPWLQVKGHKGDVIRITPAELINADSSANQKASGSPCYYTYTCKGDGIETWQPQFSYYGFRYLQVDYTSSSADPFANLLVKGLHTRNAAPEAGNFECSNDLFNRTGKLIDWAIKSNMVSVFTDCPHREKLGWLEEAHLMGSSVRYNYDIATLCRKNVHDMMLAQTDSGLIPEIAPEFVHFDEPFRDSPEWGSNAIIMPWYAYQWYGDRDLLEQSYSMMQRYAAYLERKSVNYILYQGLGDWYDLGPNHPGVSQLTPKGVTATAMWYYDLSILSQAARLLGHAGDAEQYDSLAVKVRKAFNDTFYNKKTKQYATGSQTANAMAVFMQLVPKSDRQFVIDNIVADLRSRGNSLTAGDIGFRYLLRVLDDEGRSDVIYDMNNRDDVPGYGYQLAHGATALTESWAALPIVSNNHFMLGHILEWFYSGLAGIRPSPGAVAFHSIDIRPEPVGNITQTIAAHMTPYGIISVGWKKGGNGFFMQVRIPANTTATIYLPASPGSDITETGKPLKGKPGIQWKGISQGRAIIVVGSGEYRFGVRRPSPATVPVPATTPGSIPDSAMQRVYNEVKTPFKYGLVIAPGEGKKADCPNVFRRNNQWYMTYLIFDGRGYETWLAQSNDLLHWETKGRLMSFSDTTDWDSNQKAGYIALQDPTWGGSYEWQPYNNRYWMSYFGGSARGYEAGDLSIGIASTASDPSTVHEWERNE